MRTTNPFLAVTVSLAVLLDVSCVTGSSRSVAASPELHGGPPSSTTDSWTTNGPYGGPVGNIVIDPARPTTLYASVPNVGLFRSPNGGQSWKLVSTGGCCGEAPVAMDPVSPNRIYMGRAGEGLYRSDDGGDTWMALPVPSTSASIYRAFTHPSAAGIVYLALGGPCPAGCGLLRSEDHGQTWIDRASGLTDTQVTALAFDPADPLTMYVGTVNGNVFRSANGGETWELIGQPDQFIGGLAVDPFGAHEVWASGASGPGGGQCGYLWRYHSGAWEQVSLGEGERPSGPAIVFGQEAGTVWSSTFGGGVKSRDGGRTWVRFGALQAAISSLAVDPSDPRVVYHGYNGDGIYKTTDDGETWQEVNQGLAGLIPSGLAISPDDPNTVYATVEGRGIFKTMDGGRTWGPIPTKNPWLGTPIVDPARPGRLYVGGTNGVDITENDGAAWHRAYPKPPPKYAASCGFGFLSMLSTGQPGHMVIGGTFRPNDAVSFEDVTAGCLFVSGDFGETWTYVDVGREISPVIRLASDPNNPLTVYAGTGWEGAGGGIWKSTDGGATWSPTPFSCPEVDGIAVDPNEPQSVYALSLGKIFASRDGGQTWVLVSEQGGDTLLMVATTPSTLYTYGMGGGVRQSTDGGQHWSQAAEALAQSRAWSMAAAVTEAGVTLYVGAVGGVYRLEGAPTVR